MVFRGEPMSSARLALRASSRGSARQPGEDGGGMFHARAIGPGSRLSHPAATSGEMRLLTSIRTGRESPRRAGDIGCDDPGLAAGDDPAREFFQAIAVGDAFAVR
jgi:hypothetical protein